MNNELNKLIEMSVTRRTKIVEREIDYHGTLIPIRFIQSASAASQARINSAEMNDNTMGRAIQAMIERCVDEGGKKIYSQNDYREMLLKLDSELVGLYWLHLNEADEMIEKIYGESDEEVEKKSSPTEPKPSS